MNTGTYQDFGTEMDSAMDQHTDKMTVIDVH